MPLSWNAAFESYENHLRARRAAARTVDDSRRTLQHLRAALNKRSPTQASLDDLREFQLGLFSGETSRSQVPLSAGTVARITSTIRAFFGFLAAEGKLKSNPAERLERPKVPPRPPGHVLTVKEVQRLLQAPPDDAQGLRDRAILELLYATGLRRAELLALDLSDLDHGERNLLVRHGKGDKPRLIPVNRSCYQALRRYLEEGREFLVKKATPALFLTSRGNRLHEVGLLRILRRHRETARIKKRLTPHTLRRTFATHLLKNKTNLKVISVLLGHANLQTTSVYLCLDTSELRKEILLRHPRERFEA